MQLYEVPPMVELSMGGINVCSLATPKFPHIKSVATNTNIMCTDLSFLLFTGKCRFFSSEREKNTDFLL